MEASHYGRTVVSSSSCTSIMIRAAGSGKVGVQEEAIRTRLPRSTRALPMRVITVGKARSIGVQNIALEYTKKIQHYCQFEDVQVRSNPKNTRDVRAQIASEGEYVMRLISAKEWLVLLDEHGKEVTSEQFADLMADASDTGARALVFCIGGPFGHGPQLHARANITVKLSSMVLNHQLAFVVLLEQIYRGWTILRGENYHH
ncbi:unnamed protein product [Sphagnum jensenii]|uniref:RNA methyltransferase At5g10620 n=1 Tax=Sphagnum jensenii TaxID=128206 RepID=A0ABP1AEY9_9BRYO